MANGRLLLLPLRTRPASPILPDEVLTLPEVSLVGAIAAPPPLLPAELNPFTYPTTGRLGDDRSSLGLPPHSGVDFGAPCGAPVGALRSGVVIREGFASDPFTGIFAYVRYDDGVYALWAHLSNTVVSAGDRVSPSSVIGHVGQTGTAIGCHIHLELHDEEGHIGSLDHVIDPLVYFADLRAA